MWVVLAHIQKQYGFIFIGFGDFKQLNPIKEDTINFENLAIVKQLFNYSRCELKNPLIGLMTMNCFKMLMRVLMANTLILQNTALKNTIYV